jgi:hypothetical protein
MSGKLGKKVVRFGAFIRLACASAKPKEAVSTPCFGRSQAAFSNTATLGFVPLGTEIYEEFSKIFGMPWGCANYGWPSAGTAR